MQLSSLAPVALIAGIFGALPFSSSSCPAPQRGDPKASSDFVIEAGTHEVTDLIDRSAKYLNRNYVYSDMDMQMSNETSVTLQNKLTLDAVGCQEVVSQMAFSKGIVMVPVDEGRGLYEWVSILGPNRLHVVSRATEMTPDEVLRRRNQCRWVHTVCRLSSLPSEQIVSQLRRFLMTNNSHLPSLEVGSAGNELLLRGFSHEVASAIEMIRKIEAASATEECCDHGQPVDLEDADDPLSYPGVDAARPSFRIPPGGTINTIGLSTYWQAAVEKRIEALEASLSRK